MIGKLVGRFAIQVFVIYILKKYYDVDAPTIRNREAAITFVVFSFVILFFFLFIFGVK